MSPKRSEKVFDHLVIQNARPLRPCIATQITVHFCKSIKLFAGAGRGPGAPWHPGPCVLTLVPRTTGSCRPLKCGRAVTRPVDIQLPDRADGDDDGDDHCQVVRAADRLGASSFIYLSLFTYPAGQWGQCLSVCLFCKATLGPVAPF